MQRARLACRGIAPHTLGVDARASGSEAVMPSQPREHADARIPRFRGCHAGLSRGSRWMQASAAVSAYSTPYRDFDARRARAAFFIERLPRADDYTLLRAIRRPRIGI